MTRSGLTREGRIVEKRNDEGTHGINEVQQVGLVRMGRLTRKWTKLTREGWIDGKTDG